MRSTISGFSPNGRPRWRSWPGLLADVWDVEGERGANGEYVSPHPRLFVVLEESGPGAIQLTSGPKAGSSLGAGRLSYIPAGMTIWSTVRDRSRFRHLDLHFDPAMLVGRLGDALDPELLTVPKVMFDADRVLALAQLLAADCEGEGLHGLYGESVALAMLIELFQVRTAPVAARGQLSPRRLRTVIDYIEANSLGNVRLAELADLVGLSQSYLSYAFKASTGVAPHQWHMQARIERVKTMLLQPGITLVEIAHQAGFADQAHMTRVFKQYAGMTPGAWLRLKGAAPQVDAKSFNGP